MWSALPLYVCAGLGRACLPPPPSQALVTTSVLKRIIKHPATPFLSLVEALLLFFSDTYLTVFKMESPPLHDPCAVAFVIAPELFTTRTLRVDIETSSQLSAGQTVRWGALAPRAAGGVPTAARAPPPTPPSRTHTPGGGHLGAVVAAQAVHRVRGDGRSRVLGLDD